MLRFINSIINPTVRDQRELTVYVASATGLAVAVALAVDIANQLIFFISWTDSLRSWLITVFVAVLIAVPILYGIGRTHLSLYQAKMMVEHLSLTDPLTGLPNRRAIVDDAEAAGDATLVLILVDIDRFKRVNDTYGHRVGDLVLQSIGQLMRMELGQLGMVSRLGGEEFAVISRDGQPERVLERVKGLCDRVSSMPIVAHGFAVTVTVSAGAAIGNGRSFDQLYAEADRALYVAKASGRNRVCLSSGLQQLSAVS